MKIAVVQFPGTNCDTDTIRACRYLGWNTEALYYTNTNLDKYNLVILPGGFSFGDYVAAGRLAKFSPIIKSLHDYIEGKKGFVLGICNGFQILCEMGVLPGALSSNTSGNFICKNSDLILNTDSQKTISLPIAHKYGNYYASNKDLKLIKDNKMDFLKYKKDENGSLEQIAGLYDRNKHIIGMMPHPERAVFKELGNENGIEIFKFIENEINAKHN